MPPFFIYNEKSIPTMNYKLKYRNEDFRVTEVPLMPTLSLRKQSGYTYLWVKKSDFTTFDVIGHLKVFFNLAFNDINNQGLKDEDAITEQLISVRKILSEKNIQAFNKKYHGRERFIKVQYIAGYGEKAVQERALHGNVFEIVIRKLGKNSAKIVFNYLSKTRHQYFLNYYDNQRFGMPGGPYTTHWIGKAIVESDWRKAYEYVRATANQLPKRSTEPKSRSDLQNVFRSMDPKKVLFFP